MKVFEGFLVLVLSSLLLLLPVSRAIYDYRTDVREDHFTVNTGPGEHSANVVLIKPLYDNDLETIFVSSNVTADHPLADSYDSNTRQLIVTGLTENESRLLAISYDVNALIGYAAVNTFLNWLPYLWYLILFVFPAAAIYVIVKR